MSKKDYRLKWGAIITGTVLILLFLMPTLTVADGMSFSYMPGSSFEPLEVNEQRAVILHKQGKQKMFITITLGRPATEAQASRSAVWIFPIPGNPDKADVDVTDFIPSLIGLDVERAFRHTIDRALQFPMASQPHLLPFLIFPFSGMARRFDGIPEASGVTKYKSLNRWGIHAELITVDSVGRLTEYLCKENVSVASELLSPFAPYLSEKYTLVVAWIRSYDDLIKKFPQYEGMQGNRRPSLYVEFPTDKPFYPMRPTSGYGTKSIKVSLYLFGLLSPDMSTWTFSEKLVVFPEVNYYVGKKRYLDWSDHVSLLNQEKDSKATVGLKGDEGPQKTVRKFLSDIPAGELPFTRVLIKAPAESFTQDLYFTPNSRVEIMHSINSAPWVLAPVTIILLVALSFVSGGISGRLMFGTWRPWAVIGLWNCFTIVALVAATWVIRRELHIEGTTSDPSHLSTEKVPGLEGTTATIAGYKAEVLILRMLAYIIVAMVLVSIYAAIVIDTSAYVLRVGCYSSIAALMLMAAWVVWKEGAETSAMEERISPWPVTLAGLLGLSIPSAILTYISARVLNHRPPFRNLSDVNITGPSLLPAICFLGVIAIICFFNRERIKLFYRNITYQRTLSVIFLIMGVFSYFGVLQLFALTLRAPISAVTDILVVFALLGGTWLVKEELHDKQTLALLFGIVFSFVFTVLNLVTYYGLSRLFASMGS